MAYEKLNTLAPAPKQIWEHITTGEQVLILQIEGDQAFCAALSDGKVSSLRVVVPVDKFKCWGNRGMMFVTNRKGKLPKVGNMDEYGVFNPRNANLGAVIV